jgi:hypothetical protein
MSGSNRNARYKHQYHAVKQKTSEEMEMEEKEMEKQREKDEEAEREAERQEEEEACRDPGTVVSCQQRPNIRCDCVLATPNTCKPNFI